MITDNFIKKILREATSEKSTRGSYVSPLLPGYREFDKNQMAPFTEYVTDWDDASLDHDSLDGKMSTDPKTIKKKEKRAEKIAKFMKNNPDAFAWADDAGVMNALPGKNTDAKPIKNFNPKKTVTKLDEWDELNDDLISEDLAVWFGTKKKPKGSKQPKGPWVDICRKVDGKHPMLHRTSGFLPIHFVFPPGCHNIPSLTTPFDLILVLPPFPLANPFVLIIFPLLFLYCIVAL